MNSFMRILILILLITPSFWGQNRFKLNDASKVVDIAIDVGMCGTGISQGNCGPVRVDFFRKKSKKRFQTIRLSRTQMWDAPPKANVTRRYDDQSVINFGDFNFDGFEDVAICDGNNGGYGMPSYKIYIYSPSSKRFVYSRAFTRMNYGGLGMFETDKKRRMHFVYSKSSCCWHQTQGFDVFRGKPRKVYEFTEDASNPAGLDTVEITTSKLIKGKWRTWIKHAKTAEYYR
jgi:hypothetical protein